MELTDYLALFPGASREKACFMALALLVVGYLLYKEQITGTKVAGIAVCMLGLFLINR